MSLQAPDLRQFAFMSRINLRFGIGAANDLPAEILALGAGRVFIVSDPGVSKAGLMEGPAGLLEKAGLAVERFTDVEANPRDTTIEGIVDRLKAFGADAVIGFGGGSAMDAAKGAALLATNGGRLRDYDGQNRVEVDPLPLIAVPTTAGTGSEVTANAAITDAERHYKMSIRSPRIIPSLAVLDPGLLASLPASVAATSGIDALVHAIEGYLSLRSSALSDLFAREAIRIIHRNLRPFVANPSNQRAAGSMLYGSMLAGLVISNTGTGNDHAVARALGGVCDVPHGLATAIMLAPVLEFNALACPEKIECIASDMGLPGGVDAAEALVAEIRGMLADFDLPATLGAIGIDRKVVPELVEVALGNVGPNPRRTGRDDLERLISAAF